MNLPRLPDSGAFRVIAWFLLILLLKHDSLLEPPSWDSVTGVFPPAVFLAENGFDLVLLLQQDNWWQGGPNVHSMSLFTWLIAAVIGLTGDAGATFLVLHLLTFVVAAFALGWLVDFLGDLGLSMRVSVLTAAALLLCPLVLVQVGRLYLEIPLLACHVGVARLLQLGHRNRAVVVALVAVFTKLTAVALLAALALVLLVDIRRRPLATMARGGVLALAAWLAFSLPTLFGGGERHPGNWGDPALLFSQLESRMAAIPDIRILLELGLLAMMILPVQWWFLRRGSQPSARPSAALALCFLAPILFIAGVAVGGIRGNLFLPRYLVPVLPLVMATVVLAVHNLPLRPVLPLLLGALAIGFVLNHDGRFYPPNHSSFSVVERSHQYREFNAVKADALKTLADRPPGTPAYVTRELHYMNSSPFMGYADPVHDNVFPVFREPYRSRPLDQYPNHFTLVKASIIHGGRVIDRLVADARASADYRVEEARLESGGFTATTYTVARQP